MAREHIAPTKSNLMKVWEKDTKTRDIVGNSHKEIIANAKCSVVLVKEPDIDQIYKKL